MADTPGVDESADQLRRALVAVRTMRARLDAIEHDRHEPIAIVGMSCRLPGGVDSIEQYWALLTEGRSGITEVPPSRWSLDAFYDADPDAPGKMSSRYGGFVQDIDRFDPLFFGVSPREAASMDPQQRLLLEVSWEALERAGQSPDRLKGSRTGVFVGISATDYATSSIRNGLLREIDAYGGTGGVNSVATGRISYVLGLQGPNFPVDTACSASLVAVHQAVVSLRSGESTLALAGGVNVTLLPEATVYFTKLKALAPDGRCKTFDAAADGYVRGEGCGMVVLKRLSDAVRNNDTVLAVIRGSAVNHDGRSNGLTAPNGVAQEAVIRDALAAAKLSPDAIDYVEAHGTGTPLGDPIEVQALAATYGRNRDPQRRLILGSVKTNIGHLESAAGIAGLIKVVLAIRHGEIPPNLHFKRPSPLIAWHEMPCQVATERMPWPRKDGQRVAAVSSFGFSGTNAHIILEEAPAPATPSASAHPPGRVLALSARSHEALGALARRYHSFLTTGEADGATWSEVCHTAAFGRAHFEHRLALRGDAPRDVLAQLAAAADEGTGIIALTKDDPAKIAFVFTAQDDGDAAPGPLYELEPSFRDAWDTAQRAGAAQLPGAARAYALTRLWQSWGVAPAVVAGDGDLAWVAAVIADALSMEDAVRLALASKQTRDAFADAASRATFRRPALRVLGRRGDGWADITDIASWLRSRLASRAEACPDTVLNAFGVDCALTIRAGVTHWTTLLDELVRLYSAGARIDWARAAGGPTRLVTLPTYPFQRRRHWVPQPEIPVSLAAPEDTIRHPLLGRELNLAGPHRQFEVHVQPVRPAFLGDHRVFGGAIMPAAGFVEMMLAAGRELWGTHQIAIDDLAIQEALIVGEQGSVVQTSLEEGGARARACSIYSRPHASAGTSRDWHLHVGGQVTRHDGHATPVDWIRLTPPGHAGDSDPAMVPVPVEDLYGGFRTRGIDYGPLCQGVRQLWGATDGRAIGLIELPEELAVESERYLIHPVLLDSSLQVLAAAFVGALADGPSDRVFLPIGVRRLMLHRRAGKALWAHARMDVAQLTGPRETFTGDLRLLSEKGEVVAEVDGLTWKHAGRERLTRHELADIATHFYTVSWTPQPLERRIAGPLATERQRWVIWSDVDSALGNRLGTLMTADGVPVAVVHDDDALVNTLEAEGLPVAGVVYLRGVGRSRQNGRETGLASNDVRDQCEHLLHLIQRLSSRAMRHAVYIVTENAHGLGQASDRPPFHAVAWGLARTVATESPELRCVCVDVSETDESTADRLWDEIRFGHPENQVALIGAERRVARLRPVTHEPAANRDTPTRPDRTYVVSGGTRGLGWSIARRLVAQGAENLVLIGRRAPADEVLHTIDRWREGGVRIDVCQADIADASVVGVLFDDIRAGWPPLGGIVHAAGVLDDAVLQNQTWDRFERVLAPKMHGAWNLHVATSGDALDFFVMFSSMASVFGAPGQGNYAAANAFLDGLAHWRRMQGLPAVSINWPAWADIGLAANADVERRMEGYGVRMLDVASGGRAFDLLAAGDRAQVLVLPVDWARFLGATDGTAPLLAEIAQKARVTSGVSAELASEVRAELERALQRNPEHRRAAVAEFIAGQVTSILQLAPNEPIDLRRPLDQFGLDSLMAVRLRNTLAAAAGKHLPITLIFDYPTIDAMAGYLVDDVFGIRADVSSSTMPVPSLAAEELPDLSEDELDSRIEALINRHVTDAGKRDS